MAIQEDDWRLTGQEKFIRGNVLHWARYTQPSPTWDHDHCEFCFTRFAEPAAGYHDAQSFGYTTEDNYNWICKECFDDFRERFGWELRESTAAETAEYPTA